MFLSALYRAIGRVSIWTVIFIFLAWQTFEIWRHFNG